PAQARRRLPARLAQNNHLAGIRQLTNTPEGEEENPLSPITLRKEVATLRACWNWAVHSGLLAAHFPNKGLRFPKAQEKPPFQTRDAIERIIARGGLEEKERKALWDALFLSVWDVGELLQHVRTHASLPWIYPMVFTAAH